MSAKQRVAVDQSDDTSASSDDSEELDTGGTAESLLLQPASPRCCQFIPTVVADHIKVSYTQTRLFE